MTPAGNHNPPTSTTTATTHAPSVVDSGCHSASPDTTTDSIPVYAKRMSMCASCTKPITDPFILRVHPNLEFHPECLRCYTCDQQLDESCTAFVRDGKTFCRDDYLRLFGRQKCTRCHAIFERNDMVMRARSLTYHIPCFSCYACSTPLRPGERFLTRDDELYCRPECIPPMPLPSSVGGGGWQTGGHSMSTDELIFKSSPMSSTKSPGQSPSSTPSSLCAGAGSGLLMGMGLPQHPASGSSGSLISNGNGTNRSSTSTSTSSSSSNKKSKKDKPSTRVRTVLSEQQLRILKQMYATNTRPDSITKDNLVEATGLSARVIRVWFQNKRCKDKKRQNAIKEAQRTMEKEQAIHMARTNGIGPLIAESPMTDPSLGLTPLGIHQYPTSTAIWDSTSPDHLMTAGAGQTLQSRGHLNVKCEPSGPYGAMMMTGYGTNDVTSCDYSFNYMATSVTNDYSSLSSPSCSD